MPFTADLANRLKLGLGSQSAALELQTAIQNQASDSGNTVFTSTGNITMATGQKVVVVNKASGAATTVILPPSPATWQSAIVIDGKGDAATNNITVQAASGNIDGAASVVIGANYGDMTFIYNGTQWNCVCVNNLDASGNLTILGRITTTDGVASGTAKVVGGVASSAAGVAVHDSSSEAVSASYTVPANTLKAGTLVKIKGRLTATATVSTDTLQLKLRFGSTTLTGTALITGTATDVANGDQGVFEFNLFITAAPGATAAVLGFGQYTEPAGTTWKQATLASTNFATNAALLIEATLKWSTANANSALVDWLTVEIY